MVQKEILPIVVLQKFKVTIATNAAVDNMLEQDVRDYNNYYEVANHDYIIIVVKLLWLNLKIFTHAGSQCVENSIRLVGELSQNEGFVLICLGGGWGKVCGGWVDAAVVVCRQLGFSIDSELYY